LTCGIFDSDGDDRRQGCDRATISNHLKQVFYWGTTNGLDMVPNDGRTRGDLFEPTWVDPASIVVFSGAEIDNVSRRRLFRIGGDAPPDGKVLLLNTKTGTV
jgi:hypothetical protein